MGKRNQIDVNPKIETVAIVVGIQKHGEFPQQTLDDLEELVLLLDTLGVRCAGKLVQKRQRLSAGHLLGMGKIEELKRLAEQEGASTIVVDHPLSGVQIKNLESLTCCEILDRSAVILEIFAKHAKSNEAKTQVEIAQLEYALPRMVGAWTHFGRQTGGGVRARGMGEKQIEIDRRRARERIAKLQKKLDVIKKERTTQRKSRRNELKVSLVGYTNSGKTTLMNALTTSMIKGENQLFATLDASVRAIDPNTRPNILLSDTVGFIRNLPPTLVASFKSTLDEVLNANLLLHVIDISHPNYKLQMEETQKILKEIGASEIPTILIFNKIDQVSDEFLPRILKKTYSDSMCLSAFKVSQVLDLRAHVFKFFEETFVEARLAVPYNDQNTLSIVHQNTVILDSDYENPGVIGFHIKAAPAILNKLQDFIL